ncbi:hypothetical protein MVES1_002792 [Malassezia vespertilionis]|uniref:uncharacterized protein n=1 Tax=Malassezia vespertilionis TaxID=2020962 RepID=UPI0024B21C69|nr:uncharacterized protein MVES1_002792 [Malassezia vespertilionis]WFD07428.1 hypothetical protein MVES1_002792 [Malassezia vespertilionis]
MDEIVQHLWIGELDSCMTSDYLGKANVTRIVSCMRNPPSPPAKIPVEGSAAVRSISPADIFVVPFDDLDESPMYVYFGKVNRFIAEGLQEKWNPMDRHDDEEIEGLTMRDGKHGVWTSRAPGSVLRDYVRSVFDVESLLLIRRQRSVANPNKGFLRQLELYQKERYTINLQSPTVRRFLIGQTNALEDTIQPDVFLNAGTNDNFSDIVPAPRLARVRCKICRQELAYECQVVVHTPGKGALAFEPHKRDPGSHTRTPLPTQDPAMRVHLAPQLVQRQLLAPQCSAYFVEPLTWMRTSSGLTDGVYGDRILCPNTRCNAKLGTWTWAGSQCACGAWVTPAFALQRAKVDLL